MAKTLVGTHRTLGPTRALHRRWVKAAVDPEPEMLKTYDELGPNLFRLACVLTDDAELAERLVLQTITARQGGPSTPQELAAGVYVTWLSWGNPPPSNVLHEFSANLRDIHELSADERAALGLCTYGWHTYRRAADVLGLAPDRVARLLGNALKGLAAPHVLLVDPAPAA